MEKDSYEKCNKKLKNKLKSSVKSIYKIQINIMK